MVAEIDTLVAEIAALVTSLPPEKLLHRAWWEMARQHLVVEAEVDIGTEQAVAMRMIDYVQSIIASVPRTEEQKEEVSEEDWATLSNKIEQLFRHVTLDYQICYTAKNKADDPKFDMDFEEFRSKSLSGRFLSPMSRLWFCCPNEVIRGDEHVDSREPWQI